MKRLIKNQNIKFDTHQAGDGQAVNIDALHLEKILHKPRGTKLKFHFFSTTSIEKQNSTVDEKLLRKIQKEVSRALNRDKELKETLGNEIINRLHNYRTSGIKEEEALAAAKNIASYFNLDEDFITKTIKYGKDNSIIEVTTTHQEKQTHKRHKIKQTDKDITISSRRSK